jgi:cation:H+ antiporter
MIARLPVVPLAGDAVAMLLDLGGGVLGIAILIGGAYLLVRGSVALAYAFGLSRIVVGATVVAVGTSAPEVVVSVVAALRDAPGVAIGNVVGSNIANVGLVLGIASVLSPVRVHIRLLRFEIPVLVAATGLALAVAAGGTIERWEGAFLLVGLAAFIVASLRLFPQSVSVEAQFERARRPLRLSRPRLAQQVAFILGGIAGLAAGAELIVSGASAVAARAGVSDFVIGLTLVAVGTSLPEMATSILAAVRREHEIAIANIVGSNIFNLLGVLGVTALAVRLPVDVALFAFEMPFLALSAFVLVPLVWSGFRVVRLEGAALLAGYAAFVAFSVVRGAT